VRIRRGPATVRGPVRATGPARSGGGSLLRVRPLGRTAKLPSPGKASEAASSQETDSVRSRNAHPSREGSGAPGPVRPPVCGVSWAVLAPLPFFRDQRKGGFLVLDTLQASEQRRRRTGSSLASAVALALVAALAGCGAANVPAAGDELAPPIIAADDVGREVRLAGPAQRVVSLLPAGSETVLALAGAERLVGRTRYDVDPALQHLPSVGGGLDPSIEALASLRPDLVIAFETAGGSPVSARLGEMGIPVFGIRTQDTTDIYRNIAKLGTLLGLDARADSLNAEIRARLARIARESAGRTRPSVVYLASVEPPIVAGRGTFIMELVGVAGGRPVELLERSTASWPQLSLEELVRQDPDVVLIPVHRDPAASLARLRRAPGWRELRAVREGRIATIDANLANRPGPRIAETAEAVRAALAPYLDRP
jgi:iron complex transport system substrate-binding protein